MFLRSHAFSAVGYAINRTSTSCKSCVFSNKKAILQEGTEVGAGLKPATTFGRLLTTNYNILVFNILLIGKERKTRGCMYHCQNLVSLLAKFFVEA
jgi:hypothetical protein